MICFEKSIKKVAEKKGIKAGYERIESFTDIKGRFNNSNREDNFWTSLDTFVGTEQNALIQNWEVQIADYKRQERVLQQKNTNIEEEQFKAKNHVSVCEQQKNQLNKYLEMLLKMAFGYEYKDATATG